MLVEHLEGVEERYPGVERINLGAVMGVPRDVFKDQPRMFAEEVMTAFSDKAPSEPAPSGGSVQQRNGAPLDGIGLRRRSLIFGHFTNLKQRGVDLRGKENPIRLLGQPVWGVDADHLIFRGVQVDAEF